MTVDPMEQHAERVRVTIAVVVVLDEMEGTVRQSAEIALENVEQAVRREYDAYAEAHVTSAVPC